MTESVGYLSYGWTFIRAAEHLAEQSRTGELEVAFPDAPPTVLMAHGIELIIKSFIWHSRGEVAFPRTHDLSKLFDLARECSLSIELTASEADAFAYLNDLTGAQPYEARYLITGAKPEIPLSAWIAISRKLMDAVERVVCPQQVQNVGLRTALERLSGCAFKSLLPSPLAGEGSGMGGVHPTHYGAPA
jgi:hypothetical protein